MPRRDDSQTASSLSQAAPIGPAGVSPAARPRYGLRHPVVLILLAAGGVDIVTGDPMGGTLLAAVGAGLGWSRVRDAAKDEREEAPAGPPVRGASAWWAAAALAGYAALAGLPARFSWPATLAVIVPGAVVVALARRPWTRNQSFPEVQPEGAAPWVVVLVGLCVWELVNLFLQPSLTVGSYDHPTLSELAEPFLNGHWGRSIGITAWLATGWYLLERR